MNIEKMILEGATVVDVRTVGEFMGGNAPGSVNIPLNEVVDRELELKEMKQPIVLCCASGNRSGQATAYLNSRGIECVNAGSWLDVNYVLAQKAS
jgi:phage shock protein E